MKCLLILLPNYIHFYAIIITPLSSLPVVSKHIHYIHRGTHPYTGVICIHARIHKCTHQGMYAYRRGTQAHTCTHRVYMHRHLGTHIHTGHTHVQTKVQTTIHMHPHRGIKHTHIHTAIHVHIYTQVHRHAHECTQIHSSSEVIFIAKKGYIPSYLLSLCVRLWFMYNIKHILRCTQYTHYKYLIMTGGECKFSEEINS